MTLKKIWLISLAAIAVFGLLGTSSLYAQQKSNPVADVSMGAGRIIFNPVVDYKEIVLTVSGPNDFNIRKVFNSGSSPYFDLMAEPGNVIDGSYVYELRVTPNITAKRTGNDGVDRSSAANPNREPVVQSGAFTVMFGSIVNPRMEEPDNSMTILHLDDVVIVGSLCVGQDCVNGESFGFDTLRLKENNLRIHFQDTSTSASFPTNDWRIIANDSANGGANYLAFEDSSAGRKPFVVEAGARANALYVESDGDIGIGTANPTVDLHILNGNTPTLRLEQDGSSGFTPQTWDIAGNEANFFIRDVSNGSALPFRIFPGSSADTLEIRSSGVIVNSKLGIGTDSPAYQVEIKTSGTDKATFAATYDGGAIAYLRATASQGVFGTLTPHQLRFLVNENWVMELQTDNSLNMVTGATCNTSGQWVDNSTREAKENIEDLGTETAVKALNELKPVTFNYKVNKEDPVVGFIAEDVPDLVAQQSRKGLSSMDIVAVLTKVVQEQQKSIEELKKEIAELKKEKK